MSSPSYHVTVIDTPIGETTALWADAGLAAFHVGPREGALERLAHEYRIAPALVDDDPLGLAVQLAEYFDGVRRAFDIELDWRFAHGFTREALQAACTIPYGQTASYGEVAELAGRPRAARAVGTACRTSPFSIVVPVHRVVRADGSIGEYGAHPEVKRFLVDLESRAESTRATRRSTGDDGEGEHA